MIAIHTLCNYSNQSLIIFVLGVNKRYQILTLARYIRKWKTTKTTKFSFSFFSVLVSENFTILVVLHILRVI